MIKSGSRLPVLLTTLALTPWLGATLTQAASKTYGELLTRLPENANVLFLVDVDGLISSPLGQREGWHDQLVNRPAGVLGVSGDVSKVVVASFVDFSTLEERGKLGMAQARGSLPELSVLAAREG